MNKRFVIHFFFILFLFSLFCFLSIIQRCSYPFLTHVINNKRWKWIHLRRSCFLSSIWFLGPCYFYCVVTFSSHPTRQQKSEKKGTCYVPKPLLLTTSGLFTETFFSFAEPQVDQAAFIQAIMMDEETRLITIIVSD